MLDEFSKNFDAEMQNHSLPTGFPKARRRRKASLSDSEIMTISFLNSMPLEDVRVSALWTAL